MGYRGTRYEVQAGDKDRTPFEKVQKLFEMIGLEGYDVQISFSPHTIPLHTNSTRATTRFLLNL